MATSVFHAYLERHTPLFGSALPNLRDIGNPKLTPMVRLQTVKKHPIKNPTGPGENIKLPIYFLKLHTVCATKRVVRFPNLASRGGMLSELLNTEIALR